MACTFDRELLSAYLDGEAEAAERSEVERHLAACRDCTAELADLRGMSERLRRLEPRPAPPTVAEGVERAIGRRSPRFLIFGRMTAAAALVLVAVTVAYVVTRSRPLPSEERPAAAGRALDQANGPDPRSRAAAPEPAGKDASKVERSAEPPPETEVLVITPLGAADARAVVERFLEKLGRAPGQRSADSADQLPVRAPHIETELTEEEAAALEKELAAIARVERSTLGAEARARRLQRGIAAPAPAAPPAEEKAAEDKEVEALSEGSRLKDAPKSAQAGARAEDRAATRRRVIIEFRNPVPAEK